MFAFGGAALGACRSSDDSAVTVAKNRDPRDSYLAALSLRISDMRVEIVETCPRSPTVSLLNTYVRRVPSG